MKKRLLTATLLFLFAATASSFAFDEFNVWPNVAPGATNTDVKPTYEYWKPEKKTSDACLVVCPGGAYNRLAYDHEGKKIAQFFNNKGVTVVVLKYRVPRPKNAPKHLAAWQDAQRTLRVVRSRADEWEIDPEKIGILGFSAGGHLTLMAATSSQTASYEPVDEIDKLPCHANFAVPVYPAYVLQGGENGSNPGIRNKTDMVADFAFDDKTPPMCFIHGDADVCSSTGSIAAYSQLRKMNIPAELHIYANAPHGFGGAPTDDHLGDWLNRVAAWMKSIGF